MNKIIFWMFLSICFFGCAKSQDELKEEQDKINDKKIIEFKKQNSIYCDIDTLELDYSIESKEFESKNLYTDLYNVNDIYKKDGLYFISIDVPPQDYFLDLSITEDQYKTILNSKRVPLIINLSSLNKIKIDVQGFKYEDSSEGEDDSNSYYLDLSTSTNFRGIGKVVNLKALN